MALSLRPHSKRDVFLHLGIILISFVLLALVFFYVYLPYTTHHNQIVTVPDLSGKKLADLEAFLEQNDLEYLVDDSTYDPLKAPTTVYQQYPVAGSQVKKGRKIFIGIHSFRPPMVKMPNLINRSLVNAEGELASFGLRKGDVKFVPDLQQNAVLKQFYNGREITEGSDVPKGSLINLVVGDGLGNQEFDVPILVGQSREEAEFALTGMGLNLGAITYQTAAAGQQNGEVVRQNPSSGKKIHVGDLIDLWIAGPDPKAGPATEGNADDAAEETPEADVE